MYDVLWGRKGLHATLFMYVCSRTPQDLYTETLMWKIGGVTLLGSKVSGAVCDVP